MRFPLQPFAQLEQLSQALNDPVDDLQAILAVLFEDLTAAVPSFTGLLITIPADGEPVAITAVGSTPAATSMLLPLHAISGLPARSELVLYAAEPDAFVTLADDARATYGLDGQVQLDRHLPPPLAADEGLAVVVVEGAAENAIINQAIGVLIAQGHPPERARDELTTRAAADNISTIEHARRILEALQESEPTTPRASAQGQPRSSDGVD